MHNAFSGVSPASIEWRESKQDQQSRIAPYSFLFDDIYFNPLDGVAESQYVFLEGNKLASRFQSIHQKSEQTSFTVFETGFGSGLNFLLTADLWRKAQAINNNQQQTKKLYYYSVEQYPLNKNDLIKLHQFLSEQEDYKQHTSSIHLEQLYDHYPPILPGVYSLDIAKDIQLTLLYFPLNQALKKIAVNDAFKVDAWFLDGFAPSRNPDMWSKSLWHFMALYAHSKNNSTKTETKSTSFATFTAASHVRKMLENYGFLPEKRKGFAKKREMLVGNFNKKSLSTPKKNLAHDYLKNRIKPYKVAIIGAGLAGSSLAYYLAKNNIPFELFEHSNEPAANASSMPALLATPNLSRDHNHFSQLTFQGFYQLNKFLKENPELINATEALQLTSEKYSAFLLEQLLATYQNRLDNALSWQNFYNNTGLKIPALQINGPLFCQALLSKVNPKNIHLNHTVQNLDELADFDHIILCTGHSTLMKDSSTFKKLPSTMPLRGQLTAITPTTVQANKFNQAINYDQHLFCYQKALILGATFATSSDPTPKKTDDKINIEAANTRFNADINAHQISNNWVGIRASTYDRFPFIGLHQKSDTQSIWLNYGYGTRGLSLSLLGANIISSSLSNQTLPIGKHLLQKLSPKRLSSNR